jgi:transposase-like protein
MVEIPDEEKRTFCPVCVSNDDVRIAGKKGNVHQYLCKNCDTYFIPHTVYNIRKKIWHDKIKWKRIRHLEKYLGLKVNKFSFIVVDSYQSQRTQ